MGNNGDEVIPIIITLIGIVTDVKLVQFVKE